MKLSLISGIKVRHDPSLRFKVAHMAKYSFKINENLKYPNSQQRTEFAMTYQTQQTAVYLVMLLWKLYSADNRTKSLNSISILKNFTLPLRQLKARNIGQCNINVITTILDRISASLVYLKKKKKKPCDEYYAAQTVRVQNSLFPNCYLPFWNKLYEIKDKAEMCLWNLAFFFFSGEYCTSCQHKHLLCTSLFKESSHSKYCNKNQDITRS